MIKLYIYESDERELNEFELFKKRKEQRAKKLDDDMRQQLDFLDFEEVGDNTWQLEMHEYSNRPVLNLNVDYKNGKWRYYAVSPDWYKEKYIDSIIKNDNRLQSLFYVNDIKKLSDLTNAIKICDDLTYDLK